jgi:hypothetical protein
MTHISIISPSGGRSPRSGGTQGTDKGFGQRLALAIQDTQGGVPAAPPNTLGEIQATLPAGKNGSPAITQAEGLLNLMDAYARQLQDPGKTLRQIAPVLNAMKNQAATLLSASQGDVQLHAIAKQLAVTAEVETIKFHRGDYV